RRCDPPRHLRGRQAPHESDRLALDGGTRMVGVLLERKPEVLEVGHLILTRVDAGDFDVLLVSHPGPPRSRRTTIRDPRKPTSQPTPEDVRRPGRQRRIGRPATSPPTNL